MQETEVEERHGSAARRRAPTESQPADVTLHGAWPTFEAEAEPEFTSGSESESKAEPGLKSKERRNDIGIMVDSVIVRLRIADIHRLNNAYNVKSRRGQMVSRRRAAIPPSGRAGGAPELSLGQMHPAAAGPGLTTGARRPRPRDPAARNDDPFISSYCS
ncbi:hypothetical protein EVAR_92482_1 [Eumeta japonica]|uniref:Uncharacterized protein n=1 Tax=Eumeta variegata TaxID=151549 RepID=A0A4C1T612_EUMVA|nr:hypothetical protein EVAR_92482_1 [Eumeta japonica]